MLQPLPRPWMHAADVPGSHVVVRQPGASCTGSASAEPTAEFCTYSYGGFIAQHRQGTVVSSRAAT